MSPVMIGKTVQMVYAEIEFLVSKMITVMVSTDRMSHALCRSLLVWTVEQTFRCHRYVRAQDPNGESNQIE